MGDAARVAVDHLDQRLLQGLGVGVHTRHVADDAAALHVHPGAQLRADGLDLAVRCRPLYPEVEGVLVAHDVLHDLEARCVAAGLDHLLVLPLPRPVGGEVAGRLRARGVHEVLDVAGDGLNGWVALPSAPLCLFLEPLVEHLDRAQVGGEAAVEPDVFDEGLLLRRQAREGSRLLRLPAQGQGSEVVPVLSVLLLQLEGPGVRLEDVLGVAVKGLRAHAQAQGEPLGVGRAVGAVVVDKVLNPCGQLDRLVEPLLVALDVVVEVGVHIPGRRL